MPAGCRPNPSQARDVQSNAFVWGCARVRACACVRVCVCVFEGVRIDVATQLLSDQTSASTSTFCKSGPKLVSCKTNAFRWRRWVLQLKQSGRPDVCTSSNNFAIAEWVTCDRLP
jgi:hypothetical protein